MDKNESFKTKFVDTILQFRIWVLLFFVILSFVAVSFQSNADEVVVISGVVPGSFAEKAGVDFNSLESATNFEQILYVNNNKIIVPIDYYNALENLSFNDSFVLKTNKNPQGYNILVENKGDGKSVIDLIGISVSKKASSNIKLGIELAGGSRLILKPISNITDDEYTMLVDNLQNRLDVYGASGTKVNKLEDAFSNDKFVIVESISSNKNDIFELISRQGEFEAKISNVTVFTGENVVQVFNDPQHAGLKSCSPNSDGDYVCSFTFSIEINSEGGDAFFNQTSSLSSNGQYLSDKICFYLDGNEITCLNIASSFKYNKITNPQITVTGNPMTTESAAIDSGAKEMKFLQTILSTQSLPSELEVVQSYSISSSQGDKLLDNALLVGIFALFLVSAIVAIRYQHLVIFIAIFTALITEVIIVFGVAAFMRLSIDLAAIGGLIAAIGTGVDDQIIITDEQLRNKNSKMTSRNKLKAAMYIIMIAYLTTLAAMVPLYFAGLNILQGFAFMIIIGVTVGVFITRPAYAAFLRVYMTTRKQRKEEEEDN